MPSIAQTIIEKIEQDIEGLLPAYKKSPYVYSLAANNRESSKVVYAVRPTSALNVQTVMRSITMDQTFEVILSRAYLNKDMNDTSLRDKIFQILEDHETLYKEVFLRRLSLNNVLLVQNIDLLAPDIDEDNEFVSITAVYTVKYRSEITV